MKIKKAKSIPPIKRTHNNVPPLIWLKSNGKNILDYLGRNGRMSFYPTFLNNLDSYSGIHHSIEVTVIKGVYDRTYNVFYEYKNLIHKFQWTDEIVRKEFLNDTEMIKFLSLYIPQSWIDLQERLGTRINHEVKIFLDKYVYNDNPLGKNGEYRLYQHNDKTSFRFQCGKYYVLIYNNDKAGYEDTPLDEIIDVVYDNERLLMENGKLIIECDDMLFGQSEENIINAFETVNKECKYFRSKHDVLVTDYHSALIPPEHTWIDYPKPVDECYKYSFYVERSKVKGKWSQWSKPKLYMVYKNSPLSLYDEFYKVN